MEIQKPRPNAMAKLTEKEVRHIRYLIDTKQATAAELARDYGMGAEAIRRIARRETWAWVSEAPKQGEKEWNEAADASLQKLLENNPDLAATATAKMAQTIKAAKGPDGDSLVNELTGEQNERSANATGS